MPHKPIPEFDLNAFSGSFRAESDRACAVLGAALLDARLESLYNRRLRSFKKELLSNSGPLGTFSARIRVANALAWISDDVRFDLDQIRSIRNEFAHNFDHELSFAEQSITDKCRTLCVAQVLIHAHEHAASSPHRNLSQELIRAMGAMFQSPRQRFEITVEMLAQHLDELAGNPSEYEGPNLRDELWALGSRLDFKVSISITATASPAAPDSEPPPHQTSSQLPPATLNLSVEARSVGEPPDPPSGEVYRPPVEPGVPPSDPPHLER
jgi:DNA-binding MltR family transcriptional regulator